MRIDLKPCPFCGSKPLATRDGLYGGLTIKCPKCSKTLYDGKPSERWAADFGFYGWNESSDGAVIAAWNRRAVTRPTCRNISKLVDKAYERGQKNGFKPRAFECECDALQLNDWPGHQVARAKWLHAVTANHLHKARKTIRELRGSVKMLQRLCDERNALLYAYRGCNATTDTNASVPEHYQGDGYVTCDRAIEAASAQRCIVSRSPLQYWYWATALKYVWRMWSKGNPEADMRKAIDCLRKCMGEVADG